MGENAHTKNDRISNARINADDLEIFYNIAVSGGYRPASRELGISFDTIRRRVDRLEKELDRKLFIREPSGVTLTTFGEELFQYAKSVNDALSAARRISHRRDQDKIGLLSLCIPEGLGSLWILPRLHQFQEHYPDITLQTVLSGLRHHEVDKRYDISIRYGEPKNVDRYSRKLGYLNIMLYAARGYEAFAGLPHSLNELKEHKLVHQTSDQFDEMVLMRLLGHKTPSKPITQIVDSSVSAYQLVRSGKVITALPTYLSAVTDNLMPIPVPEARTQIEFWLSYQKDVEGYKPAMDFVDWLVENFDHKKFPFFSEEFVDPQIIARLDRSNWRENCLDYFVGHECENNTQDLAIG